MGHSGKRAGQLDRLLNENALLPPDLRDWVPADHLAHFVIEAVEALDLREVRVNTRGTGSEQYPPAMLLALLGYSYTTGTFGSRRIEQSTYDNVAVRLITGDTHPDHATICAFRAGNKALVTECFVKLLQLAQELKLVKVGQVTVSIDGTKIAANASQHAAVSYARADEQLAQLELEVEQLLAKAEQADATPLQDGLTIPEEIARRQERKAAIAKAHTEIKARAFARYAAELAEHEKKMTARQAQGKKPRGRPPEAPTPEPTAPAPGASIAEVMRYRLQSSAGKALYKLRQQTVEPVFGIIKSVLGFRQFLLRGLAKVSTEWTLVCLAYNLKRLHRLGAGRKLALAG